MYLVFHGLLLLSDFIKNVDVGVHACKLASLIQLFYVSTL